MKLKTDYWQINIDGVSVWSYFRNKYNETENTIFKAKIKIGLKDVLFLFKFLLLPLNRNSAVYFISSRKELVSVQSMLSKDEPGLVFIRDEGGVGGNVFLIEVLRYLFRVLSPLTFRNSCKVLNKQLGSVGICWHEYKNEVKAAVGDYYFNRFVSLFVGSKNVYFSNCVIPKIEKSASLYNSIELQHGVIHLNHLDYSSVPKSAYKSKFYCWGEYWFKKLKEIKFSGEIILGVDPFCIEVGNNVKSEICVFTTVNEEYSKLVELFFSKYKKGNVQKHPRDYFNYSISNQINEVTFNSPAEYMLPILHDSTLIMECVFNKRYFVYLGLSTEDDDEIKARLLNKYGVDQSMYTIARSVEDMVAYVEKNK